MIDVRWEMVGNLATLASACLLVVFLINAKSLGNAARTVDIPDGVRKLHNGIVPKVGGFVLCLPTMILSTMLIVLYDDPQYQLSACVVLCTLFLIVGFCDDRFDLTANVRLVGSIAIASIWLILFPDVGAMSSVQPAIPQLDVAVLLMAMMIVISPHIVNLADGDHGIVPGILLILSALMLDVVQDPSLHMLLVVLTFGCVALLVANIAGMVFLGSSGCYGVTALLLGIAVTSTASSASPSALEVYLAVLALPTLDAFRVMLARILDGRSPFDPDRSHLHHLLRDWFGWPNSMLIYWFLILIPGGIVAPGSASTLLFATLCLVVLVRLVAERHPPAQQNRLVFVVNSLSFFISHRLPVALEAQARGFRVHVAAWNDVDPSALQKHGIEFHPVRFDPTGLNPIRDLVSFVQLVALFRRLTPDLVHLVTIKPVLYGGLAARALGVKGVVAAVPGLGMVFTAKGFVFVLLRVIILGLYRLALNHPRCVVVVQNARDRELLVGHGIASSDRVRRVLGSGVCLRSFRPAPTRSDLPVVLFASRLIRQKGVQDFVEAARLCRARGLAARFVVVGDPPSHHRAAVGRDELDAWCAEGSIEWWGHCDDMPEAFRSSHIFCLPTHYPEGVPKVLLEAAAAGKPIVTTATPGCQDVVQNGVNGFLVAPSDPRGIADALGTLLQDPGLRDRMGRLSRVIAENWFDVDMVIGASMDIYRQLLDPRREDPNLAPTPIAVLPRQAPLPGFETAS